MCINEQELIDILSILPVNKAIGADLISHKILKATKFSSVRPLYLLFNRSLRESVFLLCGNKPTLFHFSKKMTLLFCPTIDQFRY